MSKSKKCYREYNLNTPDSKSIESCQKSERASTANHCMETTFVDVDDQMANLLFRLRMLGIRTIEWCQGHLSQQDMPTYIIMEINSLSCAVSIMMYLLNNDRVNFAADYEQKDILIEGKDLPETDECAKLKARYEFYQLFYEAFDELGLHDGATGTVK